MERPLSNGRKGLYAKQEVRRHYRALLKRPFNDAARAAAGFGAAFYEPLAEDVSTTPRPATRPSAGALDMCQASRQHLDSCQVSLGTGQRHGKAAK